MTADQQAAAAGHVRGGTDRPKSRATGGSADLLTGLVHLLGPAPSATESHLQT